MISYNLFGICVMSAYIVFVVICLISEYKEEKTKDTNENADKKDNKPLTCPEYCGVACVDGTCPKAHKDEYEEYGIPVIWTCDECHLYAGCEDCTGYGCDEALKRLYGKNKK